MDPDFLFIGPDKSGSTWIYRILHDHPECFVPEIKDIYFFDRFYDRGLDWYRSFFRAAEPHHRAAGELSHDYLFSPDAAVRIRKDFPDIRLMSCLRDPVERSFSNYLFLIRSGLTRLPFEEALDSFPELIENSLYHEHVSRYLRLFEAGQVKILFFWKLRNDPESFAAEIFEFLDLSFRDDIDYHRQAIPSSRPRSRILSWLMRRGAGIARQLKMETIVGRVKNSSLSEVLYIPYTAADKPVISIDNRTRLQAIFEDDIRKLQDLLEVDLSHWLDQQGLQDT